MNSNGSFRKLIIKGRKIEHLLKITAYYSRKFLFH